MSRAVSRRERRTLLAASFANGPVDLLDFVLPLWAGAALGASATQVGLLAAVEMAVSVVVRPVAGVLADSRERRSVAAVGAIVYAVSLVAYAVADDIAVAYGAAVLGGIGGALFFVAVRAIIGERLASDSGVYPRLLSAEETGSWVAFVAGIWLLALIDFRGVFLLSALACVVAAGLLLSSPARAPRDAPGDAAAAHRFGLGDVGRRLRPMLVAVVITMAAEAAIGLLLLLHLQRGFDLLVGEIALVFLPGAIAMSVLPPYLHRFVRRYGRTRVLATASVSSALFAGSLALAPNPFVVAGLWILSGVAWAAVIPIQQAVIAEASGSRLGRGMGLYESAGLLGGLVGSLAAGLLYDGSSWTVACLVAAVVILSGAVIVPRAVRALGVPDIPLERAHTPEPAAPEPAAPVEPPAAVAAKAEKSPRRLLTDLAWHTGAYAAAQIGLAVAGLSWLVDTVTGDGADHDGLAGVLHGAGRVWTVILVVDAVWTGWRVIRARTELPDRR